MEETLMNGNNIIALVITGVIGILLISFGIILHTGRGSFLIAGQVIIPYLSGNNNDMQVRVI
jgi:hypothetical protein